MALETRTNDAATPTDEQVSPPDAAPRGRPTQDRVEIRVSGFGGQGVIFLGYALGKSAAIQEGRHATLNQSFGPEARGSACSAEVILSDNPIDYPYIRRPSILISMSQDAFRRYITSIEPKGLVLIDEDLVDADAGDYEVLAVPATRIAEELGRRIVANMVMLGFIGATTRIVAKDAMREAVRTSVPSGTEELNLKAFDRGFAFGTELVAKKAAKKSI